MMYVVLLGALNLGPAMLQQQGIFSPPTSGITHSPVQILGEWVFRFEYIPTCCALKIFKSELSCCRAYPRN